MSARQLLTEANGALARAQALIERAGQELGPPTEEPLTLLAWELKRLRRRIHNATTTATGTSRGHR